MGGSRSRALLSDVIGGHTVGEAVKHAEGAKPYSVTVGVAECGQGERVVELVCAALPEADSQELETLATGIDEYGGKLPMPYGRGRVLVARTNTGVQGVLFLAPPQKWLGLHPPEQRELLARLVVEVEALAVDERWRGGGIGLGLLGVAERAARAEGVMFCVAKVATGNMSTQRWYRRQGFVLMGRQEPLVFRTRFGVHAMDEPGDGFRLAVKALDGRVKLRRAYGEDGGSYWAPHRVTGG